MQILYLRTGGVQERKHSQYCISYWFYTIKFQYHFIIKKSKQIFEFTTQ